VLLEGNKLISQVLKVLQPRIQVHRIEDKTAQLSRYGTSSGAFSITGNRRRKLVSRGFSARITTKVGQDLTWQRVGLELRFKVA